MPQASCGSWLPTRATSAAELLWPTQTLLLLGSCDWLPCASAVCLCMKVLLLCTFLTFLQRIAAQEQNATVY